MKPCNEKYITFNSIVVQREDSTEVIPLTWLMYVGHMMTACYCLLAAWTQRCSFGIDWLFQRLMNQVSHPVDHCVLSPKGYVTIARFIVFLCSYFNKVYDLVEVDFYLYSEREASLSFIFSICRQASGTEGVDSTKVYSNRTHKRSSCKRKATVGLKSSYVCLVL